MEAVTSEDTTWHLGTRNDCTNRSLDEMVAEDSSYQPYQATTDLSADGRVDIAFALVKGDSGRIYWIQSGAAGYQPARLLGTVDWIREGGLVVRDTTLVFGRFYSDVTVTWLWHSATQSLEALLDDEPQDN